MNKKERTVDSYDKSARAIAHKFDEQGARISDIDEVFTLLSRENPRVVEIGCGNGRDAKEIIKHTDSYLGFDISKELISLAQEKVPNGNFVVADTEDFKFEKDIDVVFAFASLLHVDKEHLQDIFEKVYQALNAEGIFRVSLKYNDKYKEIEKEDEFGVRTFYLYSKEDIQKIANGFKIVRLDLVDLRDQRWLEMILQK